MLERHLLADGRLLISEGLRVCYPNASLRAVMGTPMKVEPHRTRTQLASRFLLGVAAGSLLGLLTSLSPVIAVVAMLAALAAAVIGVVRHADSSRIIQLAGTLIGVGAFLVYGVVNTISACFDTDDFCGNANVWPLGALAVVTVGAGTVAAAVAVFRSPGQ